jgi:hypothetical protein
MNFKEVQVRPRPRVAVVGEYEEEFLQEMQKIFPTVWAAFNLEKLEYQISHLEVDLLIILDNPYYTSHPFKIPRWTHNLHVISFVSEFVLPGRHDCTIFCWQKSNTEDYFIPELEPSINSLLLKDLSNVNGTKDFSLITLNFASQEDLNDLEKNALIKNKCTGDPYATIFQFQTNKNFALLPNQVFNKIEWIKLLVSKWAAIDDVFSQYSEENDIKWKTKEETDIADEIKKLEIAKEEYIKNADNSIAELEIKLREQSLKDNQSIRRLIKGQGDELVDEVKKCFEIFGFSVYNMDEERPEEKIKLEDLRISDQEDFEWIAIAEVKGYSKSTGKTADLQQIQRFVEFFMKETGKFPNRRFYIVNGAFELEYSQRKAPFESNPDDVEMFGESDGLIISTLDLFQLLKNITPETDLKKIRDIIKNKTGRLELSDFDL